MFTAQNVNQLFGVSDRLLKAARSPQNLTPPLSAGVCITGFEAALHDAQLDVFGIGV